MVDTITLYYYVGRNKYGGWQELMQTRMSNVVEPFAVVDPATIYLNDKGWLHRDDGPALPVLVPPKWRWFLNGEMMPFDTWLIRSKLTDEEKVIIKLKYG